MLFEDLILESKYDDLDDLINSMRRGRKAYASGQRYSSTFGQQSYPTYYNVKWIIPGEVIRSCRPGYSGRFLEKKDVDHWLKIVKERVGETPKSIITFLTDREIREFYNFNLLDYYKELGIQVRHMPKSDPIFDKDKQNPMTFTLRDLQQIKKWIDELPKPVLIHCSAGIDRTGEVAAYLMRLYNRENPPPKPEFIPIDQFEDDEAEVDMSDINDQIDKFNKKFGNWKKYKFGNF